MLKKFMFFISFCTHSRETERERDRKEGKVRDLLLFAPLSRLKNFEQTINLSTWRNVLAKIARTYYTTLYTISPCCQKP